MVSKKMGRNEPCWCGSGLKFKKCHLGREAADPVKPWQFGSDIRREFSVKLCSVPDGFKDKCSGPVVRAHTIPKSSSLKKISEEGHVYGYNPSPENFTQFNGSLEPELIGINKASTFSGFCQFHDDAVFSPIEKGAFQGTGEQCFLLAYRAFCRDYYTKAAASRLGDARSKLDSGRNLFEQIDIQSHKTFFNVGIQAGLNDNIHHKKIFDSILEDKRYEDVRAIVFEFDGVMPVMSSGATNPDYDFDGNLIQDLMDLELTPDLLTLTSFHDGTKSYIVMAWASSSHSTCHRTVRSLMSRPECDKADDLVQFIYRSFENVFMSPKWWISLEANKRDELSKLMAEIDVDGYKSRSMCLGLPKVIKTHTVGWSLG